MPLEREYTKLFIDPNFEDYYELLMLVNEFDFNGLLIYSATLDDVDNIFKSNEQWRDEYFKEYIFFADSSISWYCYNIESGIFYELNKPSGEVMATFNAFDEMISCALQDICPE